jgi:hypothetical protein
MARASDQKYLSPNPGYRKGDSLSGGGTRRAGGGKHRIGQDGWEKGDIQRRVDVHGSDPPLPVKPGSNRAGHRRPRRAR